MKSGRSGSTALITADGTVEASWEYWVLPDKPMGEIHTRDHLAGGWQNVDHNALVRQTESIKGYLTNTLDPNSWMCQNDRFFFRNKEDWELFKTMCQIGWQ